MSVWVIIVLVCLQAVVAFLTLTNPFLPDSNWISAGLTFVLPVPTMLLFFAHSGKKLQISISASMGVVFGSSAYLLFEIAKFKVAGMFLFLLAVLIIFILAYPGAWLLGRVHDRFPWSKIILFPAFYTSLEYLRNALSPHFWLVPGPHRLLANSLVGMPWSIQMASIIGGVGLGFWVMFVGGVMALLLWETSLRHPGIRRRLGIPLQTQPLGGADLKKTEMLAAGLGLLLLVLLGWSWADTRAAAREQAHPQAMVRPALLQSQYDPSRLKEWTRSAELQAEAIYREMIRQAAREKADFVVFTENALPLALPKNQQMWDELRNIFQETRLAAIVGAITDLDADHSANVWYAVDPQGRVVDAYIKRCLVPFGEYMPMRPLVQAFMNAFNFVTRKSYQVLKMTALQSDKKDLVSGKVKKIFTLGKRRIAVVICIELQYMQYARDGVRLGAEAILCPDTSNWFLTPPYYNKQIQHCALRAVETRRWVGHVSSMGSATFVDALGKVQSRAWFGKRAVLVQSVPCLTRMTFYTRYGDVFSWLCLLTVLAFVVAWGWGQLPAANFSCR